MQYLIIDIPCGGVDFTTCSVEGESCIDGVCKCGQADSCESRTSGSYCDPIIGECRCSEYLESCSDPSSGIFCETNGNVSCKCSATAQACSGNEYCTLGSCTGNSKLEMLYFTIYTTILLYATIYEVRC